MIMINQSIIMLFKIIIHSNSLIMNSFVVTIIFCLLSSMIVNVHCNTFIWDPNNSDSIEMVRPFGGHSTFSNPAKCVIIPSNLTLCHGIKYNEMRLPNLLYHESINEVIEQSNSWIQLIKIGCHPDTQLFLCSLFSPVCLDQTIPPCRSLCENVKNSCEPSMLRHGFSWPSMMQCSLFPIDNNMCIESQIMMGHGSENGRIKPEQPVTIHRHVIIKPSANESTTKQETDNNTAFQRRLLDAICNSEWVIKMGLNQIQTNQIRVKKFKTIFGNLNATAPFTLSLNKSAIINDQSPTNNPPMTKSRQKFIIIGNGDQVSNLSVRLVVSWLKNTQQIKKALRRAKTNMGCKKYNLNSDSGSSTTSTTTTTSQPQTDSITTTTTNSTNEKRKNRGNRKMKKQRKPLLTPVF